MVELSEGTLKNLRELEEDKRRAHQRQQLILQTVLAEHDLDPKTHEVDLQDGVIREVESATQ